MAETSTISQLANKISSDIFEHFRWSTHPRRDDNFGCHNTSHTSGGTKPKPKKTHPGDVLFYYDDPYVGRRVYLHTDLKSYARDSVGPVKLRAAVESLSMTVECARSSEDWRQKYSVTDDINFEVRGLLFIYNHDGKYVDSFDAAVKKANLETVPVAPSVYIHFLGPKDIARLFTVTHDIQGLLYQKTLPKQYSFYYPDLTLARRHGDMYRQAATIESLTAPYFIITYEQGPKLPPGYVIYYNRSGATSAEFEYFLDSLSRYQMLEPDKLIRVRLVSENVHVDFLSNFHAAKARYVKAWGLDPYRANLLDDIKLEKINAFVPAYVAPEIGWNVR
jgi:hypothetical protein